MGLMALQTLDPVYLAQFILSFSSPTAGPRRTKWKRLIQNTLSRFSLGACVHTFLAKMLSSHTVPGECISRVTAPLKCHAFPQKPSLMRREFSCPVPERVQSKASETRMPGENPHFAIFQVCDNGQVTWLLHVSNSSSAERGQCLWHKGYRKRPVTPARKALSTVAGTQQYLVRFRYSYYYFLPSQAPHLQKISLRFILPRLTVRNNFYMHSDLNKSFMKQYSSSTRGWDSVLFSLMQTLQPTEGSHLSCQQHCLRHVLRHTPHSVPSLPKSLNFLANKEITEDEDSWGVNLRREISQDS